MRGKDWDVAAGSVQADRKLSAVLPQTTSGAFAEGSFGVWCVTANQGGLRKAGGDNVSQNIASRATVIGWGGRAFLKRDLQRFSANVCGWSNGGKICALSKAHPCANTSLLLLRRNLVRFHRLSDGGLRIFLRVFFGDELPGNCTSITLAHNWSPMLSNDCWKGSRA